MNKGQILLLIIIFLFSTGYYLTVIKHEIFCDKKSINGFCHRQRNIDLERKGFFSDKYLVKKYISENIPEIKIPKTLFITKNPIELRNFNFPENFVLKCTSGSQMNILVRNRKFNIEDIIKKSEKFLNINYSTHQYRKIPFLNLQENHYDYCDKSIMIEENLGENIKDYKFFIIKGKLSFIQVDNNRFSDHSRNFYDKNFKKLDNVSNCFKNFSEEISIDNSIKDRIEKAAKIFYQKEKFDFFRLDVYIKGEEIYFSEITFTPGNCCEKFNTNFSKNIYNQYISENNS